MLLGLGIAACAVGGAPSALESANSPGEPAPSELAVASATANPTVTTRPAAPPNPCDVGGFNDLPVATCWAEPNARAAREADTTPVRISYTIPAAGWSAFLGAYKDIGEGEDLQRVTVVFADIQNLTVDACTDHDPLDPPVGPTVDDLAAALAVLPPFEVVSPPSDVAAFGYSGKHLEITVPASLPRKVISGTPLFTDCYQGILRTWIEPQLSYAYYGYTAPGDTEEFWILDVEGTRVVIAALRSANASAEMLAEQQAILDSVVIEP
jgi:hypothetical protein